MPRYAEISRLLIGIRGQVRQCAPELAVSVRFQVAGSTGHARQFQFPSFEGTPAQARCVEQAVRRVSFPRFRMLVFPVQHIFPR